MSAGRTPAAPPVGGRAPGPSPVDRNGLEILDEEASLALLGGESLGRIAITTGSLPVILPVNFVLAGRTILFRTSRGTKLDAATQGAVVAFEADRFDPVGHAGWSVNVIGVARDVASDGDPFDRDPTSIPRWAPLGETRVVAIDAEIVTGRRLRHHP